MTLGERIKECRLNVKMSQEKVAKLVGVSRQAVTKWESNQSAPKTNEKEFYCSTYRYGGISHDISYWPCPLV